MVTMHDLGAQRADALSSVLTDSVPLPVLQAGGFGASIDAFAWEPDPDPSLPRMRLWFISLIGSQQAVKALWAHLIKGETATLHSDASGVRFCALAPNGPRAWRFFRAPLPTVSGYHGVLVPDVALFSTERPDFLLVLRAPEDAAVLHYRFLNRRVELPLHPSWADWLWQRALRTAEVRALESYGIRAFRCEPDKDSLGSDLSAAIQIGELAIADERAARSDNAAVTTYAQESTTHGSS